MGSGAGLPGLVISILDDKKNIKLLEPNQKKISFLTHVQAKLDLKNTTIFKERIEHLEEINEETIITQSGFLLNFWPLHGGSGGQEGFENDPEPYGSVLS